MSGDICISPWPFHTEHHRIDAVHSIERDIYSLLRDERFFHKYDKPNSTNSSVPRLAHMAQHSWLNLDQTEKPESFLVPSKSTQQHGSVRERHANARSITLFCSLLSDVWTFCTVRICAEVDADFFFPTPLPPRPPPM